ncbi:MAG TPA: hypothetical protein VMS75_05140 [Terriglobales bacterium]|nr:hypothetical protein [Terriglobales bacterium]
MKRSLRIAVGFVCFTVSAGPPLSGDGAVSGSASLGVLNRYIFRGYRIGGGGVVIEPALSVSCRGFSLSFWGNIDTEEKATPCFAPDRPGRLSFNETDLTLTYACNLGKVGLTAGFIYYGTKYTAETQELYAAASLNIFGKPTLTVFRDINAYPGTYFLLSAGHSLNLAEKLTLDLNGSAAYFAGSGGYWRTYLASAGAYVGEKYRAFHDGTAKAGLTYRIAKDIGLQAGVQYVFPLSSAARRTLQGHPYNINGPLANLLVFGTTLTWGF